MKHFVPLVLAAMTVAACGSKSSSPADPASTPSGDPGATTGGGVPCEQEIAQECDEGHADGCILGVTSVHVCVDATTTAGPPCTQEIMAECEAGHVDACTLTPPAAPTHICVHS